MHGDFIALQERLLGRYSLERELGRGGSAVVYLARDLRLDRPVAIKVLHAHLTDDAEARERFRREAQLAARLAHPHIVPIYAVEATPACAWFVMAFIDGGTLGHRLREHGPLSPQAAERVLREVAWALGYAHTQGVLHRDLTLENILIDSRTGRALLTDFGLAREQEFAEAGRIVGTPGYLAPEIIRGEPPDARADLYALGVIGYTALQGQPPFEGVVVGELLARHLIQPVPRLDDGVASRRLTGAIRACLAKEPDQRPPDIPALLARLDRAAPPVTMAPALGGWFTRFERIAPLYAIAVPSAALCLMIALLGPDIAYYNVRSLDDLVVWTLRLVPAFLLLHLGHEALALRRLRRDGFGLADVRMMWPHWDARTGAARGPAPLLQRVTATLALVLASMQILVVALSRFLPNRAPAWWPDALTNGIGVLFTIVTMHQLIYAGTMVALGLAIAWPGFGTTRDGPLRRLTRRWWESGLADRFLAVATIGVPPTPRPGYEPHRPTALLLELAIEDLWSALAPADRRRLGDLPRLARALEAGARECRTLADAVSVTLAHGDAEDAPALRHMAERAEQDYRDAITMLQRLRLRLLRCFADEAGAHDLLEQIAAARGLDERLLQQIGGYAGVHRALRESLGPSPTPAVTPA